jgi:hypothetical protein
MGFYYGSSQPPPEKDEGGSIKEALMITLAVFRILAIPLGIMFAGGAYIVLVFFMFSFSALAGYGVLSLVPIALAGVFIWEKLHPPKLEG